MNAAIVGRAAGAARAILEIGIKLRQMVKIEQRLAEVEELVAEQNQQPAGWVR